MFGGVQEHLLVPRPAAISLCDVYHGTRVKSSIKSLFICNIGLTKCFRRWRPVTRLRVIGMVTGPPHWQGRARLHRLTIGAQDLIPPHNHC
jgi:hypothetical protein